MKRVAVADEQNLGVVLGRVGPGFEQAARKSGSNSARIVLGIVFIARLDYWLPVNKPTIAALYHDHHFAD